MQPLATSLKCVNRKQDLNIAYAYKGKKIYLQKCTSINTSNCSAMSFDQYNITNQAKSYTQDL